MLALRIKKAVRNGATLVVADPRKIWLTKLAKRHLQVRPGTDVWLINAMMHTILAEGLQDEEYIREHTTGFDAVREVVSRYSPEEAARMTGVDAEAIRETAREYARERYAAIFYTLGMTEHACGVDNIWSLSNLVLMTGHLGYESTGLNALRGQNNVQGLNDSGANPSYLPGYQPVEDPEVRREVRGGVGRRGAARRPATGSTRSSPGLHDGRVKALYLIGENPAQTEPNAHHVEEGLARLRVHRLAGHLPERLDPEVRRRRPPGVELRGEGRHVHEYRAPGEPGAQGARLPRARRARTGGSSARWRPRSAGRGRTTSRRRTSGTSSRTSRPNWYGIRYPRLEDDGIQWPCTDLDHPGTPYLHAPSRRCRAAAAGSSRSSTSRRSSRPTPSTRSSSRPGGRSTTTTRRR